MKQGLQYELDITVHRSCTSASVCGPDSFEHGALQHAWEIDRAISALANVRKVFMSESLYRDALKIICITNVLLVGWNRQI